MRVRVRNYRSALHPSEVVVTVGTTEGDQSLVVDRHSLTDGDLLEVGQPLGYRGADVLVELPRETYSGTWRVWVPQDTLTTKAA